MQALLDVYEFGSCRIDVARRMVTRDDRPIALAPKTFELLLVFVRSGGQVLTRQDLLSALWPDTFVEEANLSFQVSTLRKALGDGAEGWIETVPRVGYRFTPEVTVSAAARAPAEPSPTTPSNAADARWRRWRVPLVAGLAGAVLAATPLVTLWRMAGSTADTSPRRFDMTLPAGTVLATGVYPDIPEVSPDGRWVVYGALADGRRQLVLRSVTTQATRVLVDDDALAPFWAPDSRTVGFFTARTLRSISIDGGAARVMAPAPYPLGGTWGTGHVLFGSATTAYGPRDIRGAALYTQPEGGGTPVRLEGLPALDGNKVYAAPRLIPGGRAFVVGTYPEPSLWLASLERPGARRLIDGPGRVAGLVAGHLLMVRDERLVARPLDVRRGQFTGPEVALMEGVRSASVAHDGTIVVHAAQDIAASQPTWFDRKGAREGTLAEPAQYGGLTLSPDGRRAATWKVDAGNQDVWEVDLATGVLARLSSDPALDSDATWSPDGSRVAFSSFRPNVASVYVRDVATGRETMVASLKGRSLVVDGWTPDGRALVVRTFAVPRLTFLASLDGTTPLRQLAENAFTVDETQVSPDGRWVAYNSDESGTWDVYVARFPSFTSRRRVSVAGGVQPKWRGDSRELFYLAPDGSMMSVALAAGTEVTAQRPVKLFATHINPHPGLSQYGVTPDGERFLGLDRGERKREVFTVLLNWLMPENLARLKP
jgi:DNA-binding winged helix-turn-helix (wHTH) protein